MSSTETNNAAVARAFFCLLLLGQACGAYGGEAHSTRRRRRGEHGGSSGRDGCRHTRWGNVYITRFRAIAGCPPVAIDRHSRGVKRGGFSTCFFVPVGFEYFVFYLPHSSDALRIKYLKYYKYLIRVYGTMIVKGQYVRYFLWT